MAESQGWKMCLGRLPEGGSGGPERRALFRGRDQQDRQDRADGGGMKLEKKEVFTNARELAAELGCSRFHLVAVLSGRRRPGPELAAKLAERGIKTRKLRAPREQWV